MIEEDRSNLRWLVGVGSLIAVVFGGTFLALHFNEKRIDRNAHGELELARLMRLADGRPVFLVVEQVLHPGGESIDTASGRLDVVDALTGARLARQIQVDVKDCRPASPGRIWCWERAPNPPREQALVLRDLATLAPVASPAQLQAAVPALAKGFATNGGGPVVEVDGGAAIAMTNDGAIWRLDPAGCPASCGATEVHGKLPLDQRFGNTQHGTTSSVELEGRHVRFSSDRRGSLVELFIPTYGPQREERIGTSTFLEPNFLADAASPDPFNPHAMILDDKKIVVVHSDTLDHEKAQRVLSAVDTQGAVRWRAELGKGEVVAAWRIEERGVTLLVIALRSAQGWLIALDPRDGIVRWRRET